MSTDTKVDAQPAVADSADLHPFSILLELSVQDRDTIAELCAFAEGEERERFALKALRIGVLALQQARGQIDTEAIRRESDRLLEALDVRLSEHSNIVHERLTEKLKEYFDPQSGRFQERVDRLVRQDGELEQVLRRQIGSEDSELCKTLTAHFGEESALMKLLNPDQSQGLLAALRATLDEQLTAQREQVLDQFSLDNKEGALTRFIAELTDRQGELSEKLYGKLDEVVKEFSLDQEGSALNRLVKNVERAQRTITSEFSLDDENSALTRLKKILEDTHKAIDGHLSLDDEDSALARLKRELLTLLNEQSKTNQRFQEEVKGTLREMVARKEEAARSTRHGITFEEVAFECLQREALRVGDVATHVGNTTGRIKNRKWGDCVIELGPESAAPDARVVVEVKEEAKYNLKSAREEIESARKNRDAQVGLFIFSKKTAPEGIDPLARYGHDVVIVWDAEDAATDIYMAAGFSLARALCVRGRNQAQHRATDFTKIDNAILEIEKRATNLDEIHKLTETIRNNSEKIIKKIAATRQSLIEQVKVLDETIGALKNAMAVGEETLD